MRSGEWQALECRGWPDNQTCANLLAWCWRHDTGRHVVVVNYSATDAQARVPLPGDDLRGRTWALRDLLTGDRFDRQGDEMHDDGLYVALPAWGCHVLACPG